MKAVLFDLDNTLYDAKQYFLGAFNEVAQHLSNEHRIPKPAVKKKLQNIYETKTSMYSHLFDDLLNEFGLEKELGNVIRIFNDHDCKLQPYQDIPPTLVGLKRKGIKLGIVTDGDVKRQKRKIKALGLESFFDVVTFAKEIAPKPSPTPYLTALASIGIEATDAFFVGDNPLLDFEGAKVAGMKTIRILRGEFSKIPRNEFIDFEIEKANELLGIVS